MFRGLTERNRVARAGYTFLVNKYYLDDLYENVIVYGIKKPIAAACYWFNQHVIDAHRQRRRHRGQADRQLGLQERRPDRRRRSRQRRRLPGRGERKRLAHGADRQGPAVRCAALRGRRHRRLDPRDRRLGAAKTHGPHPRQQLGAQRCGVPAARRRGRDAAASPRSEEQLHKIVALVTSLATAGDGHLPARHVRLRPGRPAPVLREQAVDRRDPQPLHHRHRRHQPAARAPHDGASPSSSSSTRWTTSPSPATRRRSSS